MLRIGWNTKMNCLILLIIITAVLSGCLTFCYAADEGGELSQRSGRAAVTPSSNNYDGEVTQLNGSSSNDTSGNGTSTTTHIPTTTAKKTTEVVDEQLPDIGSAEEEQSSSLDLFFILCILGVCILLTHLVIKLKFHYLPESVAVVCLGLVIGLIILALKHTKLSNHDFTQEEILDPTTFFLIILPPIIFESGYSLHKGNFFQNIGSILVFAIFGTIISTLIVGGGVYLLGKAKIAYELTLVESFAFGSLISAVDPVATLAIFSALDVHPLLNMLVFGESILNDAVSIVLSNTVIALDSPAMADATALQALGYAVGNFCLMFFASSLLGIGMGLISALLLKHVDLRKTPSLEFATMLLFAYLPYALAEGIKLSGIMAILFCGIVMSHYTHYNLSPVTQINMQHSFRTMSFLAETSVFMYLGLAIPSFNHRFELALVLWSIVLILVGRAFNIFPLSFICNKFREHKITFKMQCVMWFSGLRGAIAYAISMHLEFGNDTRHVLVTTTLVIVLFSVIGLGGSTLPLLKCIGAESGKSKKEVSLSKTEEMGSALDAEHLSELTEEEYEVNYIRPGLKGFVRWDTKYLTPFFTRRLTNKEITDGRVQMRQLTNRWYSEVRANASDTEEETELIGN